MRFEAEVFKQRLENEYLELLSYRKALLKQIELEENKLDPQKIQEIKQNLPDKQRIAELEQQIILLREQVKEVVPKREKAISEIQDIQTYTKRLKDELGEIANLINLALTQKKIDKEEVEKIRLKKEKILEEIACDVIGANKEIEEIRKQKKEYEDRLVEKEKQIVLNLQEIAEKEHKLAEKIQKSQKERIEYVALLDKLKEERAILKKADLLTKYKDKDLTNKILILEEKISKVKKDEAELKNSLLKKDNQIKETLKRIQLKELELEQRLEAVNSKEEYLKNQEKEIEKDRKHLYSQQATLARAFERARRQKII